MKNFKLVRTYHKPYRLFKDDFVINIGNMLPLFKDKTAEKWLKTNMDACYSSVSVEERMCSEFPTWKHFLDDKIVNDSDYVSLQHYSKILDLTSIRDFPYNDTTQAEDKLGEKFAKCSSLTEFGYTKENIESLLNKYDIIVGNHYPCNVTLSIRANMTEDCHSVLMSYANIITAINSKIFNIHRFKEYVQSTYQYWRGGPLITTVQDYKMILNFSFALLYAFIFSRPYLSQDMFKNKDGRGVGYLMEMIVGFAIYCYIENAKENNKKIGYCRLLTDSAVIFGNTQK